MIKTIYIVGPAGAGKSSFAWLLSAALERSNAARWPVGDTSEPLVRWLAEIQAAGDFATPGHACRDTWRNYILANKERFRPQLVKLAEIARSILPFALVAKAEDAGARIVVGLRKREEFPCGALVNSEHMLEFKARAKVEGRIVVYVDTRGDVIHDGFDAEFYGALAHYRLVNHTGFDLASYAGFLGAKILKECA